MLLLLLLAVGCASSEKSTTWRFAIEETQGSVQDAYAQKFKEIIEAKSGGSVEVKVYPYGTLGTSDQLTELLYNGSLQFAMASPGHLGKLIPEVQVLLLHFLLSEDEAVNRQVLSSPRVVTAFDTLYAAKNFQLLSMYSEGWQVWTTQKPVRRPEDFAGMKFRVMTSPLLLAAYEAYGASPTPLPYSDVYSALQLKMIDGQVNPIFAIEEMSFYEVTRAMVFPNHAPFITSAITNREFYQKLPAQERKWLDQAVVALNDYIFETQIRFNRERLEKIRKARPELEFIRLDENQRERFRQLSLPVREKFRQAAGPRGADLLRLILEEVERLAPTVHAAERSLTPN